MTTIASPSSKPTEKAGQASNRASRTFNAAKQVADGAAAAKSKAEDGKPQDNGPQGNNTSRGNTAPNNAGGAAADVPGRGATPTGGDSKAGRPARQSGEPLTPSVGPALPFGPIDTRPAPSSEGKVERPTQDRPTQGKPKQEKPDGLFDQIGSLFDDVPEMAAPIIGALGSKALGAVGAAKGALQGASDNIGGALESIGDAVNGNADAKPAQGKAPTDLRRALQKPDPVTVDGKAYDITGINENGSLDLVEADKVPRFMQLSNLKDNKTVAYKDARWTFDGINKDGSVDLTPLKDGTPVKVAKDRIDDINVTFSNGAEYKLGGKALDLMRLDPVAQETRVFTPEPNTTFQARIEGLELDGPQTITVGEKGQLSLAQTDGTLRPITPADIAPTWKEVWSPILKDNVLRDSGEMALADQRTGRAAAARGEANLEALGIGALDDASTVRFGRGPELYDDVIAVLENPETTGDVIAPLYEFNDRVEGNRFADAVLDYADRNPNASVQLGGNVKLRGRSGPELQHWLSENHPNVELLTPPGPEEKRVPHWKIVTVGDDYATVSTATPTGGSGRKFDAMAQLSPDTSSTLKAYLDERYNGGNDKAERDALLDELAGKGVVIDDPQSGNRLNARATVAIVADARTSLDISQSEILDPVFAQQVADKAADGVAVRVRYREIDDRSRAILEKAAESGNLELEAIPADPLRSRYAHDNMVAADIGTQDASALSTSMYAWEPKTGFKGHSGFEAGVVLDGDAATSFVRQREHTPIHPLHPQGQTTIIMDELQKLFGR